MKYYIGIKFFDCKEHMDNFLQGKVYFSTTGALNLGNNTEMNYNEYEIPIYNMPVSINGVTFTPNCYSLYYEWQKMVPIFCYCQLDETNCEIYDDLPQIINIPTKFNNEGNKKFAAIFDLSDLMDRIDSYCQQKCCGYKWVKVNYVDFSKKDNSWKNIVSKNIYGFLEVHDVKHSYQNEARIILTDIISETSFEIDLGHWRTKTVPLSYNGTNWVVLET